MPANPPKHRQKVFAWHLSKGHTPAEAASLAGYRPDADAEKLARDPIILRLLETTRNFDAQ